MDWWRQRDRREPGVRHRDTGQHGPGGRAATDDGSGSLADAGYRVVARVGQHHDSAPTLSGDRRPCEYVR